MKTQRNITATASKIACASAVLLTVLHSRNAAAVNWKGPGTDWNTGANWVGNTVPNSASTPVSFGDTGAGAVNISSSVSAQSLTFNNSTGSYALTSSSGQNLTVNAITLASNVTTSDSINLTSTSTNASLLFASSSNLTITNNAVGTNANLIIGATTIIGTPGLGGVIFQGPGLTFFDGSFSSNNSLAVVGGLTMNGPGVLDYAGNGASLSGPTTLNGGALFLDFRSSIAQKGSTNATLVLYNGVLELVPNGTTAVTQSYAGGTTIYAGQTDIVAGSIFGTVTLGTFTITHNVGGTIDFNPTTGSTNFNINTNSGTTNGLLGTGSAYATVTGGSTWATVTSGAIAGLPAASYGANSYGAGINTDVTTSSSVFGITTNSLRFNTPGDITLTLSGTNTLQSGGVLATPSAGVPAILGGTLTAPDGGELLFHVYDADGLLVASSLISSAGLTKTGPGLLTLLEVNPGLTGPININRGGLVISTGFAVNSASNISFNDDRSGDHLQQLEIGLSDGTNDLVTPPIALSAYAPAGSYGTYFSTIGSINCTVTLAGVISSAPGLTTPIRFTAVATDTSGFNLTNSGNTFTGNISLQAGSLGITFDAVLGNPANTLTLEVNDPAAGGLLFLNSGITVARPIIIAATSRIISNGTDSNTISSAITGTGQLVKAGTGTLILSNSGNTFPSLLVSAGTVALGPSGNIAGGTTLSISANATFSTGTTGFNPVFSSITLNGGTYRIPSGSQNSVTNTLTITSAGGTIDFTGATSPAFAFTGTNPTATISGNATWIAPGNTAIIAVDNPVTTNVIITIDSGVTLTDGVAFFTPTSHGFTINGGGTLFQNSDTTNQTFFNAPITVSGTATYRLTDASTHGTGNFGTGTFTLDGGTLDYAGATASTSKPIALTSNGGVIQIENATTALTFNGQISGSGYLAITGPGTVILPIANAYTNIRLNIDNNATVLVTNTTGSATGTADVEIGRGTLGGSGIITGSVDTGSYTIAPSATLTGNTATTLTLGGLTTGYSAVLAFNLKTPGASSVNDKIKITRNNALIINNGYIIIPNTSTGTASLGYYKIIQYAGSIQGTGVSSLTMPLITNSISYTLDTLHDPGFIDIHKGFLGDANDDGTVNFDDFLILSQNYGKTGTWSQANFVNDPSVDFNDFLILSQHFGQSISSSDATASPEELAQFNTAATAFFSTAPTPEPSSLLLLVLATPALLRRRPKKV